MIYGRLTINRLDGRNAHCTCTCGTEAIIEFRRIVNGNTRSCGCLLKETRSANGKKNRRHGMKGTPTYKAWGSMRQRCLNPKYSGFKDYGGRGITICERWGLFENFLSDMGIRPDGLTLERDDVNGNYEPSNCRWATPLEQTRNRRITVCITLNGEYRNLGEVCAEKGVSPNLVHGRLRSGWPINDRLFCPSLIPGPRPNRRKPCTLNC